MIGKVLNLIGVILLLISYFTSFDIKFIFPNLFVTIGTIFLIAQFYIEKDFWDEHRKVLMLILIIVFYAFPMIMVPIITEIDEAVVVVVIYLVYGAAILGVFYQQNSLSIYKKEKLIFIVFFAIIEVAGFFYQDLIGEGNIIPLVLTSQILMAVGFVFILLIESMLRKKKLLNYI